MSDLETIKKFAAIFFSANKRVNPNVFLFIEGSNDIMNLKRKIWQNEVQDTIEGEVVRIGYEDLIVGDYQHKVLGEIFADVVNHYKMK